jgi:enamine deaminase RidA (YjgF/YER057c/UK114 family)
MTNKALLQEDSFSLSFYTINDLNLQDAYSMLSESIADDGYVLQERIIVPPHLVNAAVGFSAYSLAPQRCNLPLVLIGHSDLPAQYASVVVRAEKEKSRIEKNERAIKVSTEGINLLYSAPIHSAYDRSEQSMSLAFSSMRDILVSNQMRESEITRTWLFMKDILGDYELLNKAREAFFRESSFPAGYFYPASTGIEGHIIDGKPLSIEFCAFSGENLSVKRQPSPLQNEPTAYGKLFSRAMTVQFPRNHLIFISGTAAIDKTGVSVFKGDVEQQMKFTLKVLSAILKQVKGDFSHIVQAIVYLKRSADLDTCRSILREAAFPCARALFQLDTSVCRDDLLCEIEATAVIENKPANRSNGVS